MQCSSSSYWVVPTDEGWFWQVNSGSRLTVWGWQVKLIHERSHKSKDSFDGTAAAGLIIAFHLHLLKSGIALRSRVNIHKRTTQKNHPPSMHCSVFYLLTSGGASRAKQSKADERRLCSLIPCFLYDTTMNSMSYMTTETKQAVKSGKNTVISLIHWLGMNYQLLTSLITHVIWVTQKKTEVRKQENVNLF